MMRPGEVVMAHVAAVVLDESLAAVCWGRVGGRRQS